MKNREPIARPRRQPPGRQRRLTFDFKNVFSGNLNFSLPTFNDGLIEGDETFTVALTPSSATTTATNASVGIGAANSVDTTITDNDTLTISLTGSGNVPESTAASYTVNLSNPIDPDASVSVWVKLQFGNKEATISAGGFPRRGSSRGRCPGRRQL